MKNYQISRLITVTRNDISPGYQIAQTGHAISQFFIVHKDSSHLDGKYTIFGEVTSGKEIVDKIASLETNSQDQPVNPENAIIKKITIISD